MAKRKPELEIGEVLWVIPYYYDNEFDGFKEPKKCQVIEFDGYYFKVEGYDCEFDIENMFAYEYEDEFGGEHSGKLFIYRTRQEALDYVNNCEMASEVRKALRIRPSIVGATQLRKIMEIISNSK